MGLSLRLLVVDQTDCIRRLELTKFEKMRDNPGTHVLPQFAGQRVRSAEAVVELIGRRPSRVVRMTFDILTFDQAGCFDKDAFDRQQFGRFASGVSARSGLATDAEPEPGVLDARYLFADRCSPQKLRHAQAGARKYS